ncbi:MAG: hypothetical protein R3D78_08090 [Paracoccaceae bacterium]
MDENLPRYLDLGDKGMDNGRGWTLLAFIEDASRSALRRQTNEELFFCRGCHAGRANIDQTWAFPAADGGAGWAVDLHAQRDVPNRGEAMGEIAQYLQRAGGDSSSSNTEMRARWFTPEGPLITRHWRAGRSMS